MFTGLATKALFSFSLVCLIAGAASSSLGILDLEGEPFDPFAGPAQVRVFLFVRSDCPITNRYAPELSRISSEFRPRRVAFFRVYPDPSETRSTIETHGREYAFPGTPLHDPHHLLAARAKVTVAPEAAVFDRGGNLTYYGRIDDRYVDVGKSRPQAQVHDLEDAIRSTLKGGPVRSLHEPAVGCSLADVQ